MANARRYFAKLCSSLRHARAEEELAREIAAHLTLLEDDFLRRGMSPEQARLAARREYGGIEQVKELQRAERSFMWLAETWRDLRHASRNLYRAPGFTLVAVVTLALGIGVNTALFSAYNAVALKPLPVAHPNEVVRLERWFESGMKGDVQYAFSYPEYEYCRDHCRAFSAVVAASWPQPFLVETTGERVTGQFVSANYFADLGIPARLGRTFFRAEDNIAAANAIAVISYPFWQRRFVGDPRVIGSVMKTSGAALTIIGVTPPDFTGTSTLPQVPDFWVPQSMQRQFLPGSALEFQILARLHSPGALASAQSQTDALMRRYLAPFKLGDKTKQITLQYTAFFGNVDDVRFEALVLGLMLMVGSVLLVACANVANLLLARGASRQKEFGVRLALGASRGRVIRQLLTESVLLAVLGGAGGLLFSLWSATLLRLSLEQFFAGLFADTTVFQLDMTPDARVLGYALALSLITGIVFGLSPALQGSRSDRSSALKDEGTWMGRQWDRNRTRSALVVLQVGVSMTLLITSGLLLRGVIRSQNANPGFQTSHIVAVWGDFGGADQARRLAERLQTMPGVDVAALGSVPLLGTWTLPIRIDTYDARTLASYASDRYFQTLGITLLRGRVFTEQEAAAGAHVAIVSDATARRFWPGRNPLGGRLKLDLQYQGNYTEFEVVGVAQDVRFANLTRVDPVRVYVPTGAQGAYGLLIRTHGDARRAVGAVRAQVRQLDGKALPSLQIMSLEAGPLHMWQSLAQICAQYALALAVLSLLLAGLGIYGVMAYLVSQRTAEIGIRMALGATARQVLIGILAQGLKATALGIGVGVAGAAALSWALHTTLVFPGSADLFYGVPFYDPLTFCSLVGFLAFLAGAASLVPARRAIQVDPTVALRHG